LCDLLAGFPPLADSAKKCRPTEQRQITASLSDDLSPNERQPNRFLGRLLFPYVPTPLCGTGFDSLKLTRLVLLEQPLHKVAPATATAPAPPPKDSLPKTAKEENLQKARIVFGSRLAGPADRRDEIKKKSINVAGIMVPPRPEEPDNCCMSGCVNCVWDRYRDELEEWAAKSAEARARLQALRAKGHGTGLMIAGEDTPTHTATSMDDDGGGSETSWGTGLDIPSTDPRDLFADIPVGIREFMRTEKRLKEKHLRERARSGAT